MGGADATNLFVKFYVLKDIPDLNDPNGLVSVDNSKKFKDIWDALRVNAAAGNHHIGTNTLEIVIDEAGSLFSNPIDVIYIPMSRMLWKD